MHIHRMPDHPSRRSSDQSQVKSLSQIIADYRSIIYPLTILALGLGYKFSTPSRRLDAVEALQKADHANVGVLVKLQCFNRSFSDQERALAGLEGCAEIRQGLADPSSVVRQPPPGKQ